MGGTTNEGDTMMHQWNDGLTCPVYNLAFWLYEASVCIFHVSIKYHDGECSLAPSARCVVVRRSSTYENGS
jgi:hypothetical protein